MRGIILAGGLGTRLYPLTKVTSKCLLPIYNRPMVYHSIKLMVDSGIDEILLVVGGPAAADFMKVLGDAKDLGVRRLYYTVQGEAKGPAHALNMGREFAGTGAICLLFADNIFENSIKKYVDQFRANPNGARIFLVHSDYPERYGVVETTGDGRAVRIVEKPKEPKSNLIATGLYLYDNTVWSYIDRLKPSGRGELEITDLNNLYLGANKLSAFNVEGEWLDCGSFDSYLEASLLVKTFQGSADG